MVKGKQTEREKESEKDKSDDSSVRKRAHEEEGEEDVRPHMRWTLGYTLPLPKEIMDACSFDECRLCESKLVAKLGQTMSKTTTTKLSSLTQCQQHYDGSKHAKRVRARLEEWAKGNPGLPKPRKKGTNNIAPTLNSVVLEHAKNPLTVDPHWSDITDTPEWAAKKKRIAIFGKNPKKDWVSPGPNF